MAITTGTVAERLAARLRAAGVDMTDEQAAAFATAFAGDLEEWTGGAEAVPVALANKVTSTATAWNQKITQEIDWLTGEVDGGPNGDGEYPATNAAGVTFMLPCPAKLAESMAKGNAGWTAKWVIEEDGPTRAVVRVLDWVGGEGAKPAIGYVAEDSSIVGTAAAAKDVYGAIGSALTGLKTDAEAARSEALEAASAFQSLIDWDTLDESVLFRFRAAGRAIVGSVGLDAGWDIKLKQLRTSDAVGVTFFETLDTGLSDGALLDANRRVLATLPDGRIGGLVETATTTSFFETLDPSAQVLFLDPNRRVLGYVAPENNASAELVALRGTRGSADERVSQFLTPYGAPKLAELNRPIMRQAHRRLTQRALGEAAQLVVVIIGDSWSQNASRWSRAFTQYLKGQYGDAGGGWFGFGYYASYSGPYAGSVSTRNGNADGWASSYFGAWDRVYNGAPSPDLSLIFSSTVGDRVTIDTPASPVLSAVRLFYVPTADGEIRYRWGAGTWTTLSLIGTDPLATSLLANLPGGASTLEIEITAGTVKLCGLDFQSAASGVRVHKIAGSGSAVADWVAQPATAWKSGITALGGHAFVLMDGTNSQGQAATPTAWKGSMSTLIGRIREASAIPDILIAMPAENGRTDNAYPMSAYADAGRELALELSCAFRDTQPGFGDSPADYMSDGPNPLFNADKIHPEPPVGGRPIVAAVAPMFKPF